MQSELDRPCMVMVAPNGARRTRRDHPGLPLTAEELAREASACADAGATALHFHVRDEDGNHSLDPRLCREWLDRLKVAIEGRMVVQITTEAVGRHTPQEQMALVRDVRPEAVSIAPRELFGEGGEPDPETVDFLEWLREEGISPQFILYAPEEVERFHELRRAGRIPQKQPFLLFVLGRYLDPGQVVSPRLLNRFLAVHDRACPWAVCAFGREETACLLAAAAMGGHVRVGFENSLRHGNGAFARSNAERVQAIVAGLRLMGRRVAGLPDTRQLFRTAAL